MFRWQSIRTKYQGIMDFQVGERQDVMNFGGQAERFICRKHLWQVEMSEQKKLVLVLDQAFNSEEMLLYCFLKKKKWI